MFEHGQPDCGHGCMHLHVVASCAHLSWGGAINLFQLTESLDNRSPSLHQLQEGVLLEAAPHRREQTVGRGNKPFP